MVKNLGDYVIVTSKYTPATCTTGVISSATVQQITQVTDYLKTKTKALPAFNIQVLNKQRIDEKGPAVRGRRALGDVAERARDERVGFPVQGVQCSRRSGAFWTDGCGNLPTLW